MLSVNNPKIINFYNENSFLDFEETNLLFIDLLSIILNKSNTDTNDSNLILNILQNINSKCNTLESSITQVKTLQDKFDSSLLDAVKLQIYGIKDMYTSELDKYIQNNNNIQIREIQNITDKHNQLLLDKLHNEFGDKFHLNINEKITSLNNTIINEFKQQIDNNSNQQLLNTFETNVTSKYNELHKSLLEMNVEIIKQVDKHNYSDEFNMIKTHFERQKHSSNKGVDGENKLEILLNSIFPSCIVENTTGKGKSGDFIVYRDNTFNILFENKDYSNNVPPVEIEKFIRDIENVDMDGIFLSQSSGISRKDDFHIDIYNNKIIIYVHHVNYNIDKIKVAVNMLNHLKTKLNQIDTSDNNTIDESTLFAINKEFRFFLQQRNSLLELVKKFNKDITKQIGQLELPELNYLLSNKYASSDNIPFSCKYCNNNFKNAKALAAHVKKCKTKETYEENNIN